MEGQSHRRAELELALFDSFNTLLSSQRGHPKEENMSDGSKNDDVPDISNIYLDNGLK